MFGVPHGNSGKTSVRSRTARTALALGLCTAALTLSAGAASAADPEPAPAPDPLTLCQTDGAATSAPVSGEIPTVCKLVNGWD